MPIIAQGVGIQGLFVRVKIPDTVDAYGTMVQVEWDRKLGGTVPLERVDWKVGHTNKNKGPEELRLVEMDSTHIHRFEHNYVRGENRMLERNLPIAEPVALDPPSVQEFFHHCQEWLSIDGLALLERPPFQSTLQL